MTIYIKNIRPEIKHLLMFDTEFVEDSVVQIAILRWQRVGSNLWHHNGAVNIYVTQDKPLPQHFVELTGITDAWLQKHGVSESEMRAIIKEALQGDDLKPEATILIGHDIKNDVRLSVVKRLFNKFEIRYCTYTNAKNEAKGLEGYTLTELAKCSGYLHLAPHSAYGDAWALVHVFEWLLNRYGNIKEDD